MKKAKSLKNRFSTEILSVVYSFVSFLLSISPGPPPIMHCMVITSVSSVLCHTPAFLSVIQDSSPCHGLILLCDRYTQACVMLLLTKHMHASTAIFWSAYHSVYLRPCTVYTLSFCIFCSPIPALSNDTCFM